MQVETHRTLSFNLDNPKDIQKLNQIDKLDSIVMASAEFREYLKSAHDIGEGDNTFRLTDRLTDDKYVEIFKKHGVDV